MSFYGSDMHSSSSSSYRKIFGDSPRYSASPSRPTNVSSARSSGGYRSQSQSRSGGMSQGAYKRTGRSYSAMPGMSMMSVDNFDPSQSTALNNEFKIIRTNEKEQMQGLNDRFAMFIDKVRSLEQQNKVLETELVTLRARQTEPSRLAELYRQELRELRAQLEEVSAEKNQVLLERDGIEEELLKLRGKHEDEFRAREDAEHTLKLFKKDVDDATMVRLDLEKKVESLLDEINFLRKVHEEEVAELMTMVQATQVSVEMEVAKPDLTSALKEIRGQYESMASKNLQSAEEWYKTKFADLNEQHTRSTEAIRSGREELNEFRRQLQSKTIEIESLRGTNESLERQLLEMEDRHNNEIGNYQDSMAHLENELRATKSEMARHLREYQDLLNVKMALDIEIAAYRKLLEGEETRIGTGISYPGAGMMGGASMGMGGASMGMGGANQSYSYQTRMYTSSSSSAAAAKAAKKEGKDDSDKSGKISSAQKEALDEPAMAPKKTEKQESSDSSPTNQKN